MAIKKEKPDKERMGLVAERIWRGAELRIMEDVVRRIKKAGEITSTADYQINRLIEMGRSREEVERIIKESLDATWPEMFEMYDKVAEWEYVRNQEVYEQITDEFIAPEDNEWLIQLTEAIRKQTQDTMVNLSQSCGFSVMMGGRRVFTPFAEYYQKYVDTAIQDVVTGATDYNSAVRKVVTQMTNSGLRVVDYASGHTNRADVAARRAVLTGVNQITAQISEHNAEKLGTDQFEVSWHPCARPDHQTWQGKVFSKEELRTVCGYGSVTGLCGANCRHSFDPFIPGISERLYPDDWLEEQNKREAQTKEWNGKQLNAYEQTQQQRKMETAMRAQRQKIRLLQEAGADKDDIMLEKAKYQGQLNEYKQFSKKMGLLEQRERIYQDGLGKVATNTKQQNARYTPEMMRNAKIDSNQYERYREVLKEDAGSLADFRQMKYNDPEKFEIFGTYKNSVQNGMVSSLSGFENYYKLHEDIQKKVIGLQTSEGINITEQSKHFMERVIGTMSDPKTGKPRSGVTVDDISEALKTPLDVRNVKTDRQGRRSQKYIGKTATVSINPDNGALIQCNPTSEKLVRSIQDGKV